MKKFLQCYGYGLCLGFTLSMFTNISWMNWQFYVIVIPSVILVEWKTIKVEQ